MKRLFGLLFIVLFIAIGCKSSDDRLVAEVYNRKLYASEVAALLPDGLSKEDSLAFANRVIDDWLKEQIILYEAEKNLTLSEKNFDAEMKAYRQSLLKNRYFEKLTSDSASFYVPDNEVKKVIRQSNANLMSEKEIVRINYVKLDKNSNVKEELKEILFDENRREIEKSRIEAICADSIEYFIENDRWLFWEDIQLEIPIDITDKESLKQQPEYIEKNIDNFCYLIVILDFKEELTGEESKEYFESVRAMLIQKKKNAFIDKKIHELYEKARKEEKIIK